MENPYSVEIIYIYYVSFIRLYKKIYDRET